MSLQVTLQNLANLVSVTPAVAPVRSAGARVIDPASRSTLLTAQQQLFQVFEALVRVDIAVNGRSTLRIGLPVARSASDLGLDQNVRAARLESSEEINATPTSFSPFGPDWTGRSTALLTVTGAYDGSNGTGDLEFEVRRPGERGVDRPRIQVRNPAGSVIANFTIRDTDPLDQSYSLGNGLSVTVGEGRLRNRDTTSLSVFADIGSVVDPAAAFDGLRNANPNLQFGLPPIVDGSFQLNGEAIGVAVSDSIDSVIARINQSAAGVTAAFDPVTEQIELVQDTVGELPTIELLTDTSNFLVTAKLASAVVAPGKDPDTQRRLADLAIFSDASSGSFAINGQPIAVDLATDSLDDVITRINATGAGASAIFDETSGRIVLSAGEGQRELTLDSNGTGLFAALQLPEGRVDTVEQTSGVNDRRVRRIRRAVADLADGLNALYSDRGLLNGRDPAVIALRNRIEQAVTAVLGADGNRLDTGVGLQFDRSDSSQAQGSFATVNPRKLALFLEKRTGQVRAVFNGAGQQVGLVQSLATAVEGIIRQQASVLGSRGTLFDATA